MKKTPSLPLRITTWLLAFLLTMGSCNKPANGIDPLEEVEEIATQTTDTTTQTKPTEKQDTPPATPEKPKENPAQPQTPPAQPQTPPAQPKPQTPEKPKDNPTQPQTPPAQPQTPPAQPKPQTPEKPKENPAQPQTPPAQPQTPPAQPKPQTPEKPKDNPAQPQTPPAQPQTPPAQPKPQTPEKPKENPAQPQTPPAQPQTPPAQPKPQTPEKPKENPAQPQTPPAQPKPQTPEKPKENPDQPQTPPAQPQTPPAQPKPQTPEKPKENPAQPQTPPAQPQTPPAQPKPQTPEKPKENPAQPQTPPAQPQTPPAQPKPQTPEKPKENPDQPQTPPAQPQTPPAQPKPQTPEKPKENPAQPQTPPAQPQTPPAGGGNVLVHESVNLVLAADKQEIKADGQDVAVLRLTNNGRELTEEVEFKVRKTGGSINGRRFTATRAGIYEIQATYQGRHLSNSIRIQAVATGLTMTASQTRIVADGRQSVQFSVREGNQDVSLRSTIMMQYEGEEVMVVGGRFTPRQPGVYRFVARYRGLSSNTVEVTAISPSTSLPTDSHTPTGKLTTKWVKGVNQHSGWYDVNKKNDGRGADGLRCWAASTACMLQWWQDNYRKAGYQLPPTAIDGPGTTYELKIFEHFMDCWTNEGASAFVGCRWYMTGEDAGAKYSNFARLIKHGQGGKLSSVHQAIAHQLGSDYATTVGGYSTWGAASTSREPSLAIFSRLILKALDEGIVSLDINPGYSGSHAITLWGVEYDERGIIHKMYVTDSDDLIRTPRAPRKPILHAYYLENSPREPRVIGLRGASYKNFVELLNFDTLRGYPGR